jgi:ABC-type polysaccharide/polyol phosphate transport system ATPase subunit
VSERRDQTGADAAIALDGVGKRYWQLHERAMLLKSLIPFARPLKTELWALRDLRATIGAGESVGVVGRNGAGKTSLLRLLAGVTQPTEGRLTVRGRIAPLISVGVGFHPEMSGRENIYVNGMLLGLTRAQVRDRLEEIVAFSELADFIDTPVKFYSSGMFMRLGFTVAAHVDPDVMLVDEVLAVGDIAFQLKCMERMRELQQRGTTILFVSHNMHLVRLLCPRTLLLRDGRLDFDGDTETAISRVHELLGMTAGSSEGQGGATVIERHLLGPDGPTDQPRPGDEITYRLTIRFNREVDSPQLFFNVLAEGGITVYGMATAVGRPWQRFAAGDVAVAEVVFRARLGAGTYRLVAELKDRNGREVLWSDQNGVPIFMAWRLGASGLADLEATIAIDGHDLTDHQELLMVKPDDPASQP